jgi:hypothetical protein
MLGGPWQALSVPAVRRRRCVRICFRDIAVAVDGVAAAVRGLMQGLGIDASSLGHACGRKPPR